MQVKPLYRYEWAEGKFEDSLAKPDGKPYTERYRLIADEGKMLTYNGKIVCAVIDTDTTDGWGEVSQVESKGVLASVYGIDESLSNEAFIAEYEHLIAEPVEPTEEV